MEPFLGSGAVFFAVNPPKAYLADVNEELINAFRVVRDHPHDLISCLKDMPAGEKSYYRLRKSRPRTSLRKAARFLYLNRLGFNGIYRVNRKGEYNVPFGGRDRSLDYFWRDDRLLLASKSLAGARLEVADFEQTLRQVGEGDFCYCDPVYVFQVTGETFRRYTHAPFGSEDVERLGAGITAAVDRGAHVALSWPSGSELLGFPAPAADVRMVRQSTVGARAATASSHRERLILFGDRFDIALPAADRSE